MSERERDGAGFEIPDLELEPVASKRSPAAARSSLSPSTRGSVAASGRELDLEAAPGITLGGEASAHQRLFGPGLRESPFAAEDDFELIRSAHDVELATGDVHRHSGLQLETGVWPTGRSRPTEQLPVDAREVLLVADYGTAPNTALLSPLYAYRVYARRLQLRKALAEHDAALAAAERERDTELMQLALELRPTLQGSELFRRMLEPIREIERLAGDRQAAFSEADAGYREQMAKLDAELAQLRHAEATAQALAAEKQVTSSAAQNELRRAEAKHQRVQIEIRGVLELARQALGPAGGDLPSAHGAQLAELNARALALEPELARAKSAHESASQTADQAQADVRLTQSRLRQLERQKASVLGSLERQLSDRAAGVSDAEKQRRDALAEVARAVLATRGSVAVPQATLEALQSHDRNVNALALRLETQLRALDAHDPQRVRQGVIVALSVLGLVVLAIVFKAVL